MHTRLRRLGALLLACALCAPFAALAHPSIIYLVRHAEKQAGDDPALTAPGELRATTLATLLGQARIGAIFSTETRRTRATAQPLAQRLGLTVQTYDAKQQAQTLAAKLKPLTGAVLVVGHSNTLSETVRLLGGDPGQDIADHEFDRLYQLIYHPGGTVTTVLLTVPPPTGPAP